MNFELIIDNKVAPNLQQRAASSPKSPNKPDSDHRTLGNGPLSNTENNQKPDSDSENQQSKQAGHKENFRQTLKKKMDADKPADKPAEQSAEKKTKNPEKAASPDQAPCENLYQSQNSLEVNPKVSEKSQPAAQKKTPIASIESVSKQSDPSKSKAQIQADNVKAENAKTGRQPDLVAAEKPESSSQTINVTPEEKLITAAAEKKQAPTPEKALNVSDSKQPLEKSTPQTTQAKSNSDQAQASAKPVINNPASETAVTPQPKMKETIKPEIKEPKLENTQSAPEKPAPTKKVETELTDRFSKSEQKTSGFKEKISVEVQTAVGVQKNHQNQNSSAAAQNQQASSNPTIDKPPVSDIDSDQPEISVTSASSSPTGQSQQPAMLKAAVNTNINTTPGQQVTESVQSSYRPGNNQIVIRLDPPELGKVVIRFTQQSGEVTGLLQVDRSQTKDQIQQELPQILQNLQNAGLGIKKIEVVLSNQSQDYSAKDQSPSGDQKGSFDQQASANPDSKSGPGTGYHQNQTAADKNTQQQDNNYFNDDSINMLI